MSIEEAYSREFEEIIDSEKAYELFWDGHIKDKTAFNCIFCNSRITCANLDKERAEMKNLPHFKSVEGHKDDCDLILIENIKKNGTGTGKERSFIDGEIDELKIISNIVGVKKIINNNISEEGQYNCLKKEKIINGYKEGVRRKSKYNSIRPIISKYQKYNKDKLLNNKYINVYKDKGDRKKDININYSDMFVNVSETNIDKVSKYKRIYYGEGIITKRNNDYMVIFNTGFNKDKYSIRTIFFINTDKHLSQLNNFEQWKNRLEDIVNNKEKLMIYIYTNYIKETSYVNNEKKKINVINPMLESIGCFDYRRL
ncbi:hypothetical protein [Clostridium gasigenes]|uniref:hypothetical protein n=1 Tax=Clostridium gasigenes TaxID=94869 RepID=UPI001C0E0B9A|nr:hypothetical protein [Clostridium gasigenes]MBU3105761.1 hypothetical protein [Clostridium gasigenes]